MCSTVAPVVTWTSTSSELFGLTVALVLKIFAESRLPASSMAAAAAATRISEPPRLDRLFCSCIVIPPGGADFESDWHGLPRKVNPRVVPFVFPCYSRLSRRKPEPYRSEEHTSELQSPCNLVCRLLLEKTDND